MLKVIKFSLNDVHYWFEILPNKWVYLSSPKQIMIKIETFMDCRWMFVDILCGFQMWWMYKGLKLAWTKKLAPTFSQNFTHFLYHLWICWYFLKICNANGVHIYMDFRLIKRKQGWHFKFGVKLALNSFTCFCVKQILILIKMQNCLMHNCISKQCTI